MKKLRRITPNLVREAVEKTGLTLVSAEWGDGQECGCALTCLLAYEKGKDKSILVERTPNEMGFVSDELGLSRDYVNGFINGFDAELIQSRNDDYRLGYEDGSVTRKEMGINEQEGEDD